MKDAPRSTSLETAVSVHDAAWRDAVGNLEELSRAAVRMTLKLAVEKQSATAMKTHDDGPVEVSIVFTNDAEQRILNRDYRLKDHATNVLSFRNMEDATAVPAGGLPRLLGDIVVARETVSREAREQGKALADHTTHLLVHGLLHLLGYDHQEPGEAEAMESLETEILARLGIDDPYLSASDPEGNGTAPAVDCGGARG
ncbi:MAG: rRNA maturation RNase YbeY [Kiloniellaceae bacterium]